MGSRIHRAEPPAGGRKVARVGGLLAGGIAVLALSGCSSQTIDTWKRGGMPEPASDRANDVLSLWQGAWIAALATGAIVWGLIIWAVIAYRKRNEKVPVQTRYHMPIETLFTVVPFIMVAVLFYFTVNHQNAILQTNKGGPPQQVVNVVGQQWSWTFNYLGKDEKDKSDDVWEGGTPNNIPDLYLPVGKKVGFKLTSPDTLHSFFVPDFLFKMDVFPGKTNYFELTPIKKGTYAGKCAELCGFLHSRMLFNVHVVSQEQYAKYLAGLRAKGQTGSAAGSNVTQIQEGLDRGKSGGESGEEGTEEAK